MSTTCCLQTYPTSSLDHELMATLAYTATETVLYDYSNTEDYYILAIPPAVLVATLFQVGINYAFQWFGQNGGNNITTIAYPFDQNQFKNLTDPCQCVPNIPPPDGYLYLLGLGDNAFLQGSDHLFLLGIAP